MPGGGGEVSSNYSLMTYLTNTLWVIYLNVTAFVSQILTSPQLTWAIRVANTQSLNVGSDGRTFRSPECHPLQKLVYV